MWEQPIYPNGRSRKAGCQGRATSLKGKGSVSQSRPLGCRGQLPHHLSTLRPALDTSTSSPAQACRAKSGSPEVGGATHWRPTLWGSFWSRNRCPERRPPLAPKEKCVCLKQLLWFIVGRRRTGAANGITKFKVLGGANLLLICPHLGLKDMLNAQTLGCSLLTTSNYICSFLYKSFHLIVTKVFLQKAREWLN